MRKHLAWHETLEIHELVALQTNHLIDLKQSIKLVKDRELHTLYRGAVTGTERNLEELLPFYPHAPVEVARDEEQTAETRDESGMEGFFSGHLLGMAKTCVRNYAAAITEAATPNVREIFQRHLLKCIDLHGKVFYYMLEHGYYPAYDLQELLANDIKNARKALSM